VSPSTCEWETPTHGGWSYTQRVR